MMENDPFKEQWKEYMESIDDLDYELCPMCEKVGEIMFNSGRVVEIVRRLDGKNELM